MRLVIIGGVAAGASTAARARRLSEDAEISDLEFWYAEDFPGKISKGTLLDVRSSKEFNQCNIPGSINIPLREIRSRLIEIPQDRPVFVYCRVGFRSYLAYRILRQKGFETVSILSGGTKTFRCFDHAEVIERKPDVPFIAYAEDEMAGET